VAAIDVGFVLAVAAFGWGLSLATYRIFARLRGWPMGVWQDERHGLTVLLGLAVMALAALFAGARGYGGHELSAAAIPVFGIAWAVFWTGFLRAGAQLALLLGPAAALLLAIWWSS
jgi:hypothetical protein